MRRLGCIDFTRGGGAPILTTLLATITLWCMADIGYAKPSRDKGSTLTRSIYLPVSFGVSPQMHNVVLWIDGDDTIFEPTPRVFLFTYYPELDEILPEHIDLRVRADGCHDGKGIDTNMLITPESVVTGSGQVRFDEQKLKSRLRLRRRDVRLGTMLIRLKCSESSDEDSEAGTPASVPREPSRAQP